jgi:hypothetical protein
MTSDATKRSADRLAQAEPLWIGVARLDAVIRLPPGTFLHAGPPLLGPAPIPIVNATASALVFEGDAPDLATAQKRIANGAISLRPAQDFGVVTPLAAVVSRSMLVAIVEDRVSGKRRFSPLNDGAGPQAQRFGRADDDVITRLREIHGITDFLTAFGEPIDLLTIAAKSLANGDETHGRVGIGSAELAGIAELRHGKDHPITRYLAGAPHAFLNVWMAAVAVMLAAGEDQPGSSLIVGAGGNGVDFGIRLADAPSVWRTGPAIAPLVGSLAAIGDSAVIDGAGLGALALDAAPLMAADLGVPAIAAPAEWLTTPHPILGRSIGLDAAAIARSIVAGGAPPSVCLAALDMHGIRGMIGRGLSPHPLGCYEGIL